MIAWLLAARTPSIRYLTLSRLLGLPETGAVLLSARRDMEITGPIPAILARQQADGRWQGDRSYYTPKYRSGHWSMLLLAELAAPPGPALQSGAAAVLDATGKELAHSLAQTDNGNWSCLWGNMLRYGEQAGLGSDARLARVAQFLEVCGIEAGWRCAWNGGLPCAWGAARSLWGLAAIPPVQRSPRTQQVIENGLRFLFEQYDPLQADYPTQGKVHAAWSQLSFPLFYQADVLFTLRVAADLGALHRPGVQASLRWLAKQRRSSGRWRGASPFRQRTWASLGDRDETERWVTLQAALVLQAAGMWQKDEEEQSGA